MRTTSIEEVYNKTISQSFGKDPSIFLPRITKIPNQDFMKSLEIISIWYLQDPTNKKVENIFEEYVQQIVDEKINNWYYTQALVCYREKINL